MPIVRFLRLCCYWQFLLYGAAFIVLSLLLSRQAEGAMYTMPHAFALYGTLVSILLTTCFSITLYVSKPSTDETTQPRSLLWITLAATLLVSSMIAASLFLL